MESQNTEDMDVLHDEDQWTFRPPTLLFPPDRVKIEKVVLPKEWEEIGPAVQDKYREKARWMLANGYRYQVEVEELARGIYNNDPSSFKL